MLAQLPHFLNPRHRSLTRGNVLVFASLVFAILLSGFPHTHATFLIILPTLLAFTGTADTIRCMQKRWSFYHAGVLLCIYMDLMAISLILFFLIYPFTHLLSSST
jgi:hypothetical protein